MIAMMSVFTTVATVAATVVTVSAIAYAQKRKKDSKPMTFEEFINLDSKKNDDFIALKSAELKMKYQGGKCTISFPEGEKVHSESKLYFKGKTDDDWKETVLTFDIPVSQFSDDNATQEKLKKLKSEPLIFDIDPE